MIVWAKRIPLGQSARRWAVWRGVSVLGNAAIKAPLGVGFVESRLSVWAFRCFNVGYKFNTV